MNIVLLGADGFIGRHIAFHLRDQGHHVLAQARRPQGLARMGFHTLHADLTDQATHAAAFWHNHLQDAHLINAAGLLTGTEAAFRAVHQLAPKAALAALPPGHHALLISAVGTHTDTPFAHWRRETEALFASHAILRPGMVLADTSYGGSSALRAFAAFPCLTPVVGDGKQKFNPVHAADLAAIALQQLTGPAGTQDLWQARLYLLKPLIRLTLAGLWLYSAALGLTLHPDSFPMINAPLWIARLGGIIDLALGVALIRNWRPRATALAQLAMVALYTIGLTVLAPGLWADPFGGLLKNLPILTLILTHLALVEER